MDKVKIILESGIEKEVDSIFYIFNSKYYFIYTEYELDENGYVILHLVQVGKEIKNTPNGPLDTGYMVGVETSSPDEWKLVQQSITKILDEKKSGTSNPEIQYADISMLKNLKIVTQKTFRLMKSVMDEAFKKDESIQPQTSTTELVQSQAETPTTGLAQPQTETLVEIQPEAPTTGLVQPQTEALVEIQPETPTTGLAQPQAEALVEIQPETPTTGLAQPQTETLVEIQPEAPTTELVQPLDDTKQTDDLSNLISENQNENALNNDAESVIIIDYRTKFFEEQEKNQQLLNQISALNQKIEEIKKLIG